MENGSGFRVSQLTNRAQERAGRVRGLHSGSSGQHPPNLTRIEAVASGTRDGATRAVEGRNAAGRAVRAAAKI